MDKNIDGITSLWLPDKELCSAAQAVREEKEWLRDHNGLDGIRPSELGIENYKYGFPLDQHFFNGQLPPPVALDSLENLEWYEEQLKRCVYGYEYKGTRITGDHYWILNFTPFLVAMKNSRGQVTKEFDVNFPYFSWQHDYIFKLIEEAHYEGKGFMWMSGRGTGKQQPDSEPVITPKGPVPMGDVRPGDAVVGSNGKPTKVLKIHPQGEDDVYEIELKDGRKIRCGLEHLWKVRDQHERVKTLELGDLIKDYRTEYEDHSTVYKYFIPTGDGADYSTSKLPIDPYILGAFLGDGTFRKHFPSIVIADGEDEIDLEIRSRVGNHYKYYYDLNVGCKSLILGNKTHGAKHPLRDTLKELGLWGLKGEAKFIPEAYFISSRKQRLELLQGLMDTDGYCSSSGKLEFTNNSIALADGVQRLARSLGIKSTRGYDKRGSHRIRLFTTLPIFKLKRKLDRMNPSPNKRQQNFMDWTPIISIKKLGYKEHSTCITVEAEDNLYLTTDYTVTHNTYSILSIIAKTYHLKPKSHSIVSASHSGHANEAFTKMLMMVDAISEVHPTLGLNKLQDTKSLIESGQEITRDGVKYKEGPRSRIQKVIYGDNPGATRGGRPDLQLLEEVGDWSGGVGDLKSCIGASVGSWRVGSINKCRVFMIGTGGSVTSDQAKDIFHTPEAYNVLSVNDFKPKTCFFLPSHYLLGGMKWEETSVNDDDSSKKFLDSERARQKDDMEILQKFIQEFPFTIEEVFRKAGTNIFNQRKIAQQWTDLHYSKKEMQPKRGYLEWVKTPHGKIKSVKWAENPEGNIEIVEHPYRGKDKKTHYPDLYVAGIDSIDMGSMDSTSDRNRSMLAILIKKRIVDGQFFKQTSNIYVAKYIGRSEDVRWDYEEALKLCMYYGANANVEYTRIGIVSYFREAKQYHRLMKRPMVALPGAGDGTDRIYGMDRNKNLVGTPATTQVIDHQDSKIKEYIEDNYDRVFFLDLLEQLRDYQREDRTKYDLVIAMGLCELADEDMMGVAAKESQSETKDFELFGYYTDPKTGYKKFGTLPTKSKEEIALTAPQYQYNEPVWVDLTGKPRFDDYFDVLDASDIPEEKEVELLEEEKWF